MKFLRPNENSFNSLFQIAKRDQFSSSRSQECGQNSCFKYCFSVLCAMFQLLNCSEIDAVGEICL